MEKAIFINKIDQWREDYLGVYTRVYTGNEFCQFLFPCLDAIVDFIDFMKRKKLNVSIVTPYMSTNYIYKIEEIIRKLWDMGCEFELVVNDWGFLSLISNKYPEKKIILGRILNKMKRDPRIINDELYNVPVSLFQNYKDCNYSLPWVRDFLIKKGVVRLEFDNLLQGLNMELGGDSPIINNSIYHPFFYITTTRLCRFNIINQDAKKEGIIFKVPENCRKNCMDYRLVFRQDLMKDVPLILQGNTLFGMNKDIDEDMLKKNGINRIIFEPDLPMPGNEKI